MVKMNTTLKHKKKNNVKKNSNKNKSNKNKKTTRQKKYYRKRKYSRKMKGGRVCFKSGINEGICLKVVAKYGDASSENKTTTTNIDGNKNDTTLILPVDSQIVDDLSSKNLDLDNDVVNSVNAGVDVNAGVENVDEGNEGNLGQGIEHTSSDTVVSHVVDSVDVDKIEEDITSHPAEVSHVVDSVDVDKIKEDITSPPITSPPAEVSDDKKVEDGTDSGNEVSENVDAEKTSQKNVGETEDNIDLSPTPSTVVTTTETPSSSVLNNKWKKLSKLTQYSSNKKRNFVNRVSEAQGDANNGTKSIDYNKIGENEPGLPPATDNSNILPQVPTTDTIKPSNVAWGEKESQQDTSVEGNKNTESNNIDNNEDKDYEDDFELYFEPAVNSEDEIIDFTDKNDNNDDEIIDFNTGYGKTYGPNQYDSILGGKTRTRRSRKMKTKKRKTRPSRKMRKNKKTRK